MRSVPLTALAVLLLGARAATAQQPVTFVRESVLYPAVVEDRPTVDSVRADLAHVRAAQERYYATHQTYATELSELEGVTLSSGTMVVILASSPDGWQAEATNVSLTGAEVVRVRRGDTDPGRRD